MKKFFVISLLLIMAGCSKEEPRTAFAGQDAIRVSAITLTSETVTGKIHAFGQLEPAREIAVNVDFSAPVKQLLVDEGKTVVKGQPLLEFDTHKLNLQYQNMQHTLEQAKARVKNAAATAARIETLARKKTVSQQELDNTVANLKAEQAQVKALRSQLALIKRNLKNATVLSPIDAIVSDKKVEAGEIIDSHSPLLVLEAVDSVKAVAYVSEKSVSLLKPGNKARIKTVSGDYESEIYSIASRSAPGTGNFEVRLIIENKHHSLKPGMTVDVIMDTVPMTDQLLIPQQSLVSWQGRFVVYRIQDGVAKRTPVDVAFGFEDQLYARQGVNPGDILIVKGADHVTEGSRVEVQP
ncbi:efflux RND transporter periplasmic adaptor subunit [Endozoicomonadaceae bacterium StTr2]